MSTPISDAALSIIREMLSFGLPSVTLPPHVVREMMARIDHQDQKIRAYSHLVNCHDNYLCEVDQTANVSERLRRLEAARARLTALKEPQGVN